MSLACKRLAAAACSPELLREMHVVDLQNVPAVRSFTGFLAQHGRHLQRLTVRCADSTGEGELAAVAAAAACLTIAGVGGQLMELSASGCIRSSDWLAAMRSLRRLCLDSQPYGEPLHISPVISALTALSALTLEGDIIMPAGTRLPAGIESVTLQFDSLDAFPHQASGLKPLSIDGGVGLWQQQQVLKLLHCALASQGFVTQSHLASAPPPRLQVAQLPRLASLSLDSCQYSPASLGVLSRLNGSLTSLDIESGYLTGSMSALTQLRDLRLWDCDPHGTDAVLSAALPHLRHLSRLVSIYRAAALGEATQLCRTWEWRGTEVCSLQLPQPEMLGMLPERLHVVTAPPLAAGSYDGRRCGARGAGRPVQPAALPPALAGW